MTKQEAGRKGGLATAQKHGNIHMSSLGYGGMVVVCERDFGGDVEAMMAARRQQRKARKNRVWDDKLCCFRQVAK